MIRENSWRIAIHYIPQKGIALTLIERAADSVSDRVTSQAPHGSSHKIRI
jgi:hypothetical protein